MSDPVLVALITGLCAVVGQWLISRSQNEKRKVDDAVRDARQEDRLARIENQLKIHNSYAEKFGEIQTDIAVIKNDLKHIREKE
jgi:hypothetical protein